MDEAPPAPPRRSRRLLKVILAVAGTVVLVGVPSAVALILAMSRGSGDQLVHMVPANADVYVTALLDPSLSQKRNLLSVLQHFPQLHDQQAIQKQVNSGLDDSLKSSLGLDFSHDVQPWLGSQIAVIGSVEPAHWAYLLRTTDEKATHTALGKMRSGPQGHNLQWSATQHGGVAIENGKPAAGAASDTAMVYAVFDHTAVVASDESLVDQVIDTDQGRAGNLGGVKAYQQTLQDLPSDHVLVAYVNASSLITSLHKAAQGFLDSAPPEFRDAFSNLDAYQALGAAVSLQPDAVNFDTVTRTDPSKLSASVRQGLAATPRSGAMLSWVPQDSYGLIASSGRGSSLTGMPATALAVLAALTVVGTQTTTAPSSASKGLGAPSGSSDQQFSQGLDTLGVTGPNGMLNHLTGESALFAGPGTRSFPVSAVAVLGTDDPTDMESSLQRLGEAIASGGPSGVAWQVQRDGNVDVHYLDLPPDAGVLPAYAMVDGYAVLGTDPAAVRHAVDAHRGAESNITAQPAFRSATSGQSTAQVTFLDLQRILQTVEQNLSASDRADFDKNAAPDLRPLRTFTATSSGDAYHQSSHMVVTLGG